LKYNLKNTTYVEFFNKLNTFLELIENENKSLIEIKKEIDLFLDEYIYPSSVVFLDIFDENNYSIFNRFKSNAKTENLEYERIDLYNKLTILIDYLSIIEYFDNHKEYLILNSITEKSDFLLNKLNKLFNDNFYSISLVFKLNDIEFRDGEPREIAENLFKRGYLILQEEYGKSDNSKISIKGANYIERKNKSKLIEKNTKKKNTDLDRKLDQITEYLIKLGYGQEIIFEEIEELRELQSKISKKSWKQLLKGKLFDLVVDEILSKETVNQVFEFITNSSIKLIK
tara:strand:- start:4050 stop:4904 length:855 start_codon:yes stop_codon:yes gene_type:complete